MFVLSNTSVNIRNARNNSDMVDSPFDTFVDVSGYAETNFLANTSRGLDITYRAEVQYDQVTYPTKISTEASYLQRQFQTLNNLGM